MNKKTVPTTAAPFPILAKLIAGSNVFHTTLLFLLFLFPTIVFATQIKGSGAGSCGEWLDERKQNQYHSTLHWLQGYISSYNHYIYRGKNPNGVFGDVEHKASSSHYESNTLILC